MIGVIRGTKYYVKDIGEPLREVSEAEYHVLVPDVLSVGGAPGGTPTRGWPIHSEALAYDPRQIAEAKEHLKSIGVPTEIDASGCPILTDRAHRKRFLKAVHKFDKDAGYSD